MHNNIKDQTRLIKDAIRNPYAWPGGYCKLVQMSDGEILCIECAKKNYKQIYFALKYQPQSDQWYPTGVVILWEGPSHFCINCMKEIRTEYGDPNDQQKD